MEPSTQSTPTFNPAEPQSDPKAGPGPTVVRDGQSGTDSGCHVPRRDRWLRWWKPLVCLAAVAFVFPGVRGYWAEVVRTGQLIPTEERHGGIGAELFAQSRPGSAFDLRRLTVPRNEILPGGPPKDGIPALTNPQFLTVDEARDLPATDRVIGVRVGEETRAYPLRILNYHEIVNDQLGDTPIAVTYCPLCDSVAVFDRRTPVGLRDFGVSGLLYNSNVLMYDRGGEPEGLWSQLAATAISGPGANQSLRALPVELTTWADWSTRHPETRVLSPRTGHPRDYSRNPYAGYFQSPELMFPVNRRSHALPTKSPVLGVWTSQASRAYPLSAFSAERTRLTDELDGLKLTIEYNPAARSLRVAEADDGLQWMYSLWFAWYAFHPETEIAPSH